MRVLLISTMLVMLSCGSSDPWEEPSFSRSRILTLVNKARQTGYRCGSKWYPPAKRLSWDNRLEQAARGHSEDQFRKGSLSHKGSDGKYVGDRLYDQRYFWKACGENVAYGALYEEEAVSLWLESEGHCANIMNPAYTEMGAWATGLYWTLVMAKPQ